MSPREQGPREEYAAAERRVSKAKQFYKKDDKEGEPTPHEFFSGLRRPRLVEARRKIAELYSRDEGNARELNEQYDQLMKSVDEALQAVESFECSKLGMKYNEYSFYKDSTESSDAESD